MVTINLTYNHSLSFLESFDTPHNTTMAEPGDGNIKVVVRCRPLNSRGLSLFLLTSHPNQPLQQSSLGEQNASFVCKETRLCSTPQRQAQLRTQSAQQSARLCPLVSTRVTGVLALAMTPSTVHSRPCTTTWERSS